MALLRVLVGTGTPQSACGTGTVPWLPKTAPLPGTAVKKSAGAGTGALLRTSPGTEQGWGRGRNSPVSM